MVKIIIKRTKDVIQLKKEKNDLLQKEKNSDASVIDLHVAVKI